MEGGGPRGSGRAQLRQGMDVFLQELREAARARSWRWQLTCCGDRGRTFRAFEAAARQGEPGLLVLLVDSELPVTAATFGQHLQQRDGWNLGFASDDRIHLMVQKMETWIVADRQALRDYYGAGFSAGALPRTGNLEAAPDVDKALERATRNTGKGEYRKIGHASDLLRRIDPETVRRRCPACRRLFDTLAKEIGRQ